MSGDDDTTTIVYAVNDFPAIARALKQLNGAPTHHGTALATIIPPPPTIHELVQEEQMRQAAREAARQATRLHMQQLMQRHLQEVQAYTQGLQTEEQHQRAIQHFMQGQLHQQALNQAYNASQQPLLDPGHSHGLQAAAQLGHAHNINQQ